MDDLSLYTESIGVWSETQGTEPSKYLEEKKSTEIPKVAASEMGRSPNQYLYGTGVVGHTISILEIRRKVLGKPAKEGESPVFENRRYGSVYLSTAGHEKPCWNLGGPPSKAKYDLATDSA